MKQRNKVLAIGMCFVICMLSTLSSSTSVLAISRETKDGKNMQKTLHYYGKKQYKKAQKYCNKVSKRASESCVAKMSPKMKRAYLKIVKQYKVSSFTGKYMWGYYLTDIDNDKKADLLVKAGSCEGDVRLYVYQYKNGKVKKVGSTAAWHTGFYAYPNHNGIVGQEGAQGEEWMYWIRIKNGKIRKKLIGIRRFTGKWFSMRCALNSHISYDANYNPSVNYADLS